jgi:dGTPase
LKVAQIGRRTAEKFRETQPVLCDELGVDTEVVEAACLAHDLGHPPFGHLGEKTLDKLVVEAGDPDGFEGNAQSFRVITRLSVRFEEEPGLDLTRATLAASIKYPWFRDPAHADRSKKWGAYRIDSTDFGFARETSTYVERTVEAAIMDWSDDIAYSVHDMEDLHRCRLIPWQAINTREGKEVLVDAANESWHGAPSDAAGRLREAYDRIVEEIIRPLAPAVMNEPYDGRREHRQQLRFLTSHLIGRYINSSVLDEGEITGLKVERDMEDEVRLLKQLARSYLIFNPALSAQQHGQRKIVQTLFSDIMNDENNSIVPIKFQYLFSESLTKRPRATADLISALTEGEAILLFQRLQGAQSGSVLDPIVR